MNLMEALGAKTAAAAQKFSIFLPDRQSSGEPVNDIEDWIDVAIDILTKINGGATCVAPSFGVWKNKKRRIIRENTRIVYSYITNAPRFERNFPTLELFLHSFGKHCGQEEVLVEFAGEGMATFIQRAYFIESYPKAQALYDVRRAGVAR